MTARPNRKIAVFTTSDIQVTWVDDDDDDATPIHTFEDGTKIYSTGALETALAEGYEIYVMTGRRTFGPHDDWWRALVPADHVTYGFYRGGGATDKGSVDAWRGLYWRLGFNPNNLRHGRVTVFTEQEMTSFGHNRWDHPEWHDSEKSWPSYQEALHQVGIARGHEFSPKYRARHARIDDQLASDCSERD